MKWTIGEVLASVAMLAVEAAVVFALALKWATANGIVVW